MSFAKSHFWTLFFEKKLNICIFSPSLKYECEIGNNFSKRKAFNQNKSIIFYHHPKFQYVKNAASTMSFTILNIILVYLFCLYFSAHENLHRLLCLFLQRRCLLTSAALAMNEQRGPCLESLRARMRAFCNISTNITFLLSVIAH